MTNTIYGLSEEVLSIIEKEIEDVIESDAQTSEEFIDACFPDLDYKTKAKIAIFVDVYNELFLSEEEE